MSTKRYWVWSSWECHEPYLFRGCYNTLEDAINSIPDVEEIAEVYDVFDEKRFVWWKPRKTDPRIFDLENWEPALPQS